MNKFRITDRLLLALIVFEDMFDKVVGGGSRAYHARKLFLYTPPGYKGSSLSAALHRLRDRNELERIEYKKERFIRLTKEGKKKAKETWPILKWQQQKWDGLWRMVMFDIKEKDRTKRILLQRMLKDLGFGQMQKSVYISCYNVADDVYQYIKKVGLTENVFVLVNKQMYIDKFNQLVEEIWGIKKINNQYRQLYKSIKKKRINSLYLQKIINDYLDIMVDDPCLPLELLPKPWHGFKVKELIKKKGKLHI